MGKRKQARKGAGKAGKKPVKRQGGGILTWTLILLLLAAAGWQLWRLQDQVKEAQNTQQELSRQVELQRQENDALAADIADGNSPEKMEEIARDELGLVSPGERVFYDVSN